MTGTHLNPRIGASGRRPSPLVSALLLLCAMLLGSRNAQANTYWFSISASDLMNALQSAQGSSIYSESGYFAIFVQPSPTQISSYSYLSETAPADPNQWNNTTITDYADSYFYPSGSCTTNCTWAEFGKNPSLPDGGYVTLISGANGGTGGQNIFLNNDFWGSGANPPLGWGTSDLIINRIMPATDAFTIVISTPQTLSGTYTLVGRASALKSGDPGSMTLDTKESDGISFTLSETAQVLSATPEPQTWALLTIAFLCFGIGAVRRRRAENSKHGSAV
jgi:hypothetical protein